MATTEIKARIRAYSTRVCPRRDKRARDCIILFQPKETVLFTLFMLLFPSLVKVPMHPPANLSKM
jgi:hypothetical protein